MPTRNSLPRWIVVSMFLAAVVTVPLTCRMRTRPATPSPTRTDLSTFTELAELLTQVAPEWQVVPMAKDGSLETGMYLCQDSRSWKELSLLPHSGDYADEWHGVVSCERVGNVASKPEREIQLWGEHAMRIGPFLFFGDPHLLRRIDTIIRNHAKGENHS